MYFNAFRRPFTSPCSTGPAFALALFSALTVLGTSTPALPSPLPPIITILDVNPGAGTAMEVESQFGAYWNGRIYFSGDVDDGDEPYVSDGTALGTEILSDANPGPSGTRPGKFTRAGAAESASARVFFLATSDAGEELWVTDGTDAGTTLAVDLDPGPTSSYADYLTAFDGDLFLKADVGDLNDQLVRVDGDTFEATTLGASEVRVARTTSFVTTASTLYFAGIDEGTNRVEVWSTDGTTLSQDTDAHCNAIDDLHLAGGELFFICDTTGDYEIMMFDSSATDGYVSIYSETSALRVPE